jgi:hypothetical protein
MNIINLLPFAMGAIVAFVGFAIIFVAFMKGRYLTLIAGIPLLAMGLYALFIILGHYMEYLLWLKTYGEELR